MASVPPGYKPPSGGNSVGWVGPAITAGGALLGGGKQNKSNDRAAAEQRRAQEEALALERQKEEERRKEYEARWEQYQKEYAETAARNEEKVSAWQTQIAPWQRMASGILSGHYGGSSLGNLALRRGGAALEGGYGRQRRGGGR